MKGGDKRLPLHLLKYGTAHLQCYCCSAIGGALVLASHESSLAAGLTARRAWHLVWCTAGDAPACLR